MKNLLFALFLGTFLNAQSYYKKISEKNINTERQTIVKNFILDFLKRCEDKNYSKFENYNIAKKFEMFLNEKFETNCKKNEEEYGKIELLNLESAYLNKYSINKDPFELFVFDVKTEKNTDIKFLSVWIYQDRNYLSGLWISSEKPLNPKKNSTKD